MLSPEMSKLIDEHIDQYTVPLASIRYELMEKQKCVICNALFSGRGNNAEPIAQGKCCAVCNQSVIMRRIKDSEESGDKKA